MRGNDNYIKLSAKYKATQLDLSSWTAILRANLWFSALKHFTNLPFPQHLNCMIVSNHINKPKTSFINFSVFR